MASKNRHMDDVQADIQEWGEGVFQDPATTILMATAHLVEEAVEAYLAAGGNKELAMQIVAGAHQHFHFGGFDRVQLIRKELADTGILAFRGMAILGGSLDEAIEEVMDDNRARTWHKVAGPGGFRKHIADPCQHDWITLMETQPPVNDPYVATLPMQRCKKCGQHRMKPGAPLPRQEGQP